MLDDKVVVVKPTTHYDICSVTTGQVLQNSAGVGPTGRKQRAFSVSLRFGIRKLKRFSSLPQTERTSLALPQLGVRPKLRLKFTADTKEKRGRDCASKITSKLYIFGNFLW